MTRIYVGVFAACIGLAVVITWAGSTRPPKSTDSSAQRGPDSKPSDQARAPEPRQQPSLPDEPVQRKDRDSTEERKAHRDEAPVTAVGDRITELRALVESGEVASLPALESTVLAETPETAPTVIWTVADLAALAGPAERDQAARTLGDWLETEVERDGADARGNVAVLVEALGELKSPEASEALSRGLDEQRLPLHLEVLAVHGLFKHGDPEAESAVKGFAERVEALPESEGFEEALRKEAVLAAGATLASFEP